jgi:hypothetical protein
MQIGDLKIQLIIDSSKFDPQMKNALKSLDVLTRAGKEAGVMKGFNMSKAVAELDKLAAANKKLQNEAKTTTTVEKQLGETIKQTTTSLGSQTAASDKAASGFQKAYFTVSSLRQISSSFSETLGSLWRRLKDVDGEYQNLLSSNRQLIAASKLSGIALTTLSKSSGEAEENFKLTTIQANRLTVEIAKLTSKAGEIDKISEATRSLLDLGAGQGMDTEQTLYSIKQAILGIDEGTDKLFQKNPSVIYQEYSNKIKVTVGRMTDQQKAQALLNALLDAGAKTQGNYNDFLESGAGKQQLLNNQLQETKQKLGEQLQPVMKDLIGLLGDMLKAYNDLSPAMQKTVFWTGTGMLAFGKLLPAIVAVRDILKDYGVTGPRVASSVSNAFSNMSNKGVYAFGILGAKILLVIGLVLALKKLVDDVNDLSSSMKTEDNKQDELGIKPKDTGEGDKFGDDASLSNYFKNRDKDPNVQKGKEEWEKTLLDPKKKEQDLIKKEIDSLNNTLDDLKIDDNNKGGEGKDGKEDKDKFQEELNFIKTLIDLYKEFNGQKGISNEQAYERLNRLLQIAATETDEAKRNEKLLTVQREINTLKKDEEETAKKLKEEEKKRFEESLKSLGLESDLKEKILNNLKAEEEIYENKLSLIKDDYLRRRAELELEREKELLDTDKISMSDELKNNLKGSINKKFDTQLEKLRRDTIVEGFSESLSYAERIASTLNIGFHTAIGTLLSGLKTGISLLRDAFGFFSAIMKLAGAASSGGGGGILGTIFGFSTGGPIPGSGTGDKVPLLAEPGEYMIKRPIVQQLGTGFFDWINGGGLLRSVAGESYNTSPSTATSGGNSVVDIKMPDIRVKGPDLWLVWNRNNKAIGKRVAKK